MRTERTSDAVARIEPRAGTGRATRRATPCGLLLAATLLLAACSRSEPPFRAGAEVQESMQALPFEQAVGALATALLANARLEPPAAGARHPLIVDPWIDRVSGSQVEATRAIEVQIGSLVGQGHPEIELLPFTTGSLERSPLILLGAMVPEQPPGGLAQRVSSDLATPSYRIWGVIGDLRTGRIVSQASVLAMGADVSIKPAVFFRDSPAWMPDSSVASYFRSIDREIGDALDPFYVQSVQTAALVNDGIKAYEAGQYDRALEAYTRAGQSPAGDQARVYNGLYMANQALRRPDAAERAFGRAVDLGLRNGQLAVKFVFQPGSRRFDRDQATRASYDMWLRQIASQTGSSNLCLDVIGHASSTGAEEQNRLISRQRADYVKAQLIARSPRLRDRIVSRGVGSQNPIVGTGADDESDLLDRRVEFRPVPCTRLTAFTQPDTRLPSLQGG